MKLMKHITIALVLCAIPAMAFAQSAGCDDCNHTVSYYKGTGGLIATADDDAEMVGFVASCGGTTRTGELTPNDDGVVSMLLTGDYACDADEGSFDIGPITDGGWYWINDEDNSAIGNLVAKDTLDNAATELTGAGDGVTMMAGNGAVFVKEASSGRVGILPNILPEPPPPDAAICGPRYVASRRAFAEQQTSECMLGDGGTKIRLTGRGTYGGHVHLTSGTVTRDGSLGGDIVVRADLWVNESGSYSTADTPTPALGWIGTMPGNPNWLPQVSWGVGLAGAILQADLSGAGVAIADDGDGQAEITVSPSAAYCPARGEQHTAVVNVYAGTALAALTSTTGAGTNDLHPNVAATAAGVHAQTMLTVVCPPRAAASQGQELIPDNPFPTDK